MLKYNNKSIEILPKDKICHINVSKCEYMLSFLLFSCEICENILYFQYNNLAKLSLHRWSSFFDALCCVQQIIDVLVRVLQCPLQGAADQSHLTKVFKGTYDVLYTYMIGNSRKNALYFAKYIDFFQTQITVKVVCRLNCFKTK